MPNHLSPYFSEMDESEIAALAHLLHIPITPGSDEHLIQLDQRIETHLYLYWIFRGNYYIASIGINLLYLTFPIITSNAGINVIVQFFDSKKTAPLSVGYGIGVPLSLIQVLYYMLLFSPKREALHSSLNLLALPHTEYLTLHPLLGRLTQKMKCAVYNFKNELTEHPLTALIRLVSIAFHQTILLSFNLTWIASVFVFLPSWLAKPIALPALFFGNEYCRKYSNPDYYAGIEFWKNKGGRLLLQLAKEEPNMTLQILLQVSSGVGLRAFPLCYFLAVSSKEMLGIWFDPRLVIVTTSIQGLNSLLLPTYQHYVETKTLITTALSASPEFATIKQNWLKEKGYLLFIKTEPITALLLLSRLSLGGYLGYGLTQFLPLSAYWMLLFIPLCAACLTYPLYKAEIGRLAYNGHYQTLTMSSSPPEQYPATTRCLASTLNILGSFTNTLSNIGMLLFLFGQDASIAKAIILLLSIESMINTMHFNAPKVEQTIHSTLSWFRIKKQEQHQTQSVITLLPSPENTP